MQIYRRKLRREAQNREEWSKLDAPAQQRFSKEYDDFAGNVKQQKIIPLLCYATDNFKNNTHLNIISRIRAAVKPDDDTPQEIIIPAGSIVVKKNKALLANAQDVDEYLANLKQAMLGEIKDGKKIKI